MTELTLDMENVSSAVRVPNEDQIFQWASAALNDIDRALELSVRVVDEAESAELNEHYRHKTGPTNVLSFPADIPAELAGKMEQCLLGDIAICAPVVIAEATAQTKSIESHWAHMTVHGVLHLLGYDHIDSQEAEHMEQLEIAILANLGFDNPYSDTQGRQA